MNYLRPGIAISSLFSFFLLLSSCSAQDGSGHPPDGATDSLPTPGTSSIRALLNVSQAPTDPLFYIEGQLCQHLRRIHQDRRGDLWMGTNVYGLMRYDGDSLRYYSKKNGLDFGRITAIVEDEQGNVWFGSYNGLTRYDGSSFTRFTEEDGLVDDDIWSVVIAADSTFWIGTMNGVSRFDGKEFTSFPIPKASVEDTNTILSYNRISCIMEDRDGTFWFGTDGFGICRFDGRSFTHLSTKDGLCDNNVTSILQDKEGKVWIGTMFGGISRYDGKAFTNFTREGVIEGIEVWSIFEDLHGNIWFPAENHGVYRYDGKAFTNFDQKDGLNTNGIQCFYEDREGRFWLGGWGGLFRFDGNSFYSVTREGPWE